MYQRKIIRFLIVVVLFNAAAIVLNAKADKIEKDYYFKGVVEKIKYGDKGTPEVTIKGVVYIIGFPDHDFKNKIQLGDSLIKKKDSMTYELINNRTRDIIFSN